MCVVQPKGRKETRVYALLEDTNVCCICGKEVYRRIGGVPTYYCAGCIEGYRDAILANAPWVKFTMNSERQRRKRRNWGCCRR